MRQAAWIVAYHGCDKKVGEKILADREEIRSSSNPYDWLGAGAYFWENSRARALHWAEYLKENPTSSAFKIIEPFVIGAIIDPGNCLNLTTRESLETLKSVYHDFAAIMQVIDGALPKNEAGHSADQDLVKRKLDCALINYLHDVRLARGELPFDTVCCPLSKESHSFRVPKFPKAPTSNGVCEIRRKASSVIFARAVGA